MCCRIAVSRVMLLMLDGLMMECSGNGCNKCHPENFILRHWDHWDHGDRGDRAGQCRRYG